MSKHTPGPWIAFYEYNNGPLRVGAGTNCTVASVYRPPAGDALANSKLIAAAPELLEALQEIVNADDVDDGWDQLDAGLKKARAAIAKATGGAA